MALQNMYLARWWIDDSIVEAIRMGSIVVDVMVKDKIKKLSINNILHVSKL